MEAPKTWHVIEFKTHSLKSFRELTHQGVRNSKPRHVAQMQVYMHLTGITRAMYIGVCKDTDALYIERLPADTEEGARLLAKAERVIFVQHPLARISEDPDSWQCCFCEHHALCHDGDCTERNCRTCLHSTPIEGLWTCARHDGTLSPAAQRQGCENHLFIPDLVPGEQIDAGVTPKACSPHDNWVAYRMRDSSIWKDGAPC